MAFDPKFLDELRQRLPMPSLVGRRVKLVRSGRYWKGCCPFHGEKTPSFYVYDDHFHCYGCGAHGDAISYVMQSEGRSFNEAIHELAALAGLEIPEQISHQKTSSQQPGLYEVLAAAQEYYSQQLDTPKGRIGREYFLKRGISEQTIRKFQLGWSGDGRGGLISYLKGKGFTENLIAKAGLLRRLNDDQWGGELFFNRVTFPICDRRGRVIAFGGRILGDGQPKYLNSPETPLFSKRKILFGFNHLSAISTHKTTDPRYHTLLVVEGYMDVIALHQAGFIGAVAPLGTALTLDQMGLLWRIDDRPTICFDGDAAGRRAMLHAAEEALPVLTPEHSLQFIRLPEGEDPDSLIQKEGKEAFLELIRSRHSFSEVLYELLAESMIDHSPEQKAALKNKLFSAAAKIQDRNLAKEYRKTLFDQFYAQFYPKNNWIDNNWINKRNFQQEKKTTYQPFVRPNLTRQQVNYERMCILTAMLVYCPNIIPDVEDAFCRLDLPSDLTNIREVLLELPNTEDHKEVFNFFLGKGLTAKLDKLLNQYSLRIIGEKLVSSSPQEVEKQWWHFYGLFNIEALEKQVIQARKNWEKYPDESHQRTFLARVKALSSVRKGEIEDQENENFL